MRISKAGQPGASSGPGRRARARSSPGVRSWSNEMRKLEQRYPDGNIPRPQNWGGYRIVPDVIEFWQGRASRLHDRLRYRRGPDGAWILERLSP